MSIREDKGRFLFAVALKKPKLERFVSVFAMCALSGHMGSDSLKPLRGGARPGDARYMSVLSHNTTKCKLNSLFATGLASGGLLEGLGRRANIADAPRLGQVALLLPLGRSGATSAHRDPDDGFS